MQEQLAYNTIGPQRVTNNPNKYNDTSRDFKSGCRIAERADSHMPCCVCRRNAYQPDVQQKPVLTAVNATPAIATTIASTHRDHGADFVGSTNYHQDEDCLMPNPN